MHIVLEVDGDRFGLDEVPLQAIVRWLDGVGADAALKRFLEHEEDKCLSDCPSRSLLTGRAELTEMKPLCELMVSNYKVLEEMYASGSSYHPFPWERESFHTGIAALDNITGGIKKGMVTWLAGTGGGVSGLLFEIATGIAMTGRREGEQPVGAIFSPTRMEEDISMHMLAIRSGVKFAKMRTGQWSGQSWRRLAEAAGALAELRLWVLFGDEVTEDTLRHRFDLFEESGKRMDMIILDRIERQRHLHPEALRKLAEGMNVALLVSTWLPVRQLALTPESSLRDAFPELLDLAGVACILEENEGQRILHRVKPEACLSVNLDEGDSSGESG